MSREIKLRGWVVKDSAMICHREVIERSHLQFNDSLGEGNPDIIMQWTGLKDKNSIEIYEGDILKCDWGFGKDNYILNDLPSFFYSILEYIVEGENIEVLGNIYENKDLLK